jgi:hypothetical protein
MHPGRIAAFVPGPTIDRERGRTICEAADSRVCMRRRASRYECRCHQSIQHSSRIMPWTVRGKNSLILRSSAMHFGTAGVWRCRIHRHTIRPRGTPDEHHCRCARPQLNRASNNQCDATSRPWHPYARGNCLALFVKTRMCGSPAELASRRAGSPQKAAGATVGCAF